MENRLDNNQNAIHTNFENLKKLIFASLENPAIFNFTH